MDVVGLLLSGIGWVVELVAQLGGVLALVLLGLPAAVVVIGLAAGPLGDRLLWAVEDFELSRRERSPVPADDEAFFAAYAEMLRK